MPERYLTGAIQKDGRLTDESARFLQIGCGFEDFQLPTGRKRLTTIENPFPQKIGTEKNGGLAEGVAMGKYHWAITGEDMVEDLPDHLRREVTVVRKLGFQPCQYRLGVSALAFGVETLEELELLGIWVPQTLEELRPDTKIATKNVNFLGRVIRQRGLNLQAVYDPTPETAPELRKIYFVADNFETGRTWRDNEIAASEIFLESQAVLIKARRLPWGIGQIFHNEFLPKVDQAFANPERWLNPDTGSDPANIDSQKIESQNLNRGFVDKIREKIFPGAGKIAAIVSTLSLLFTLWPSSAILNPWHSRTSKEKDLRS